MSKDLFLPPEWAKQKAVWLSWPHNKETWEPNVLAKAEEEYAYFVKELSSELIVNILILDKKHHQQVLSFFTEEECLRIKFHIIKTNDAWMRDHGPDFIWNKKTQKKELLNWEYNSWGEKYPPFDSDNRVPEEISRIEKLREHKIPMILEGGSFDINSKGDLLTTESCLLNSNRNPNLSKKEIENYLKRYLGVKNIIWLKEGIKGDDTDGHVDDFVRFIDDKTILHAWTDDPYHADYEVLKFVKEQLEQAKLWNNEKPNLIPLPMPSVQLFNNEILPCSYANFLISNNKILVPIFGCEQDREALRIIQEKVMNRKVVGIPANNIIIGLGSLHCLSKQEFDSSVFE